MISADIPIAAQLRPGQSVTFCEVSLEDAQRIAERHRVVLERALLLAGVEPRLPKNQIDVEF